MISTAQGSSFALDPQLGADTLLVGDLALSRVLAMDDARFPWLILVPRRAAATELIDLPQQDRARLIEEIAACSQALREVSHPHKLNVGALGNRVAQLHIHVIGRFRNDAAWPEPVWGRGAAIRYVEDAGARFAAAIGARLALHTASSENP